jgi:hypothetical protein
MGTYFTALANTFVVKEKGKWRKQTEGGKGQGERSQESDFWIFHPLPITHYPFAPLPNLNSHPDFSETDNKPWILDWAQSGTPSRNE